MQSEIGSNFWLNPYEQLSFTTFSLKGFGLNGADYVLLSTGRSAISFVLDTIARRNPKQEKIALVPAFTCHTVIESFLVAGYAVHTLPIERTLCTSSIALKKAVAETHATVVLLHRYFGFDTLPDSAEATNEIRSHGVVVIEDRTQCLYSSFEALPADYIVGSLRKWAGLPDGGFAICREGTFENKPSEYDIELEVAKLEASYAKYRYQFERTGEKEAFLTLYRKAEAILDNQNRFYTISPTSVKIQNGMDIQMLYQQRRRNYQTLLRSINKCKDIHPLFPVLPDNVVPLYFPIWVNHDREALQKHLASASIYAPIVWPKADCLLPVCFEAEELYKHILCLPIDQRYDMDDMERFAWRLKTAFKTENLPPDVYYLPEWLSLYATRDGDAYRFYTFRHRDGTILYPYVKRVTPDVGDGQVYYDIITPYGFNGPCVIDAKKQDLSDLVRDFDTDFSNYCQENNIIAEYVRFSPWLKNAELFGSLYSLRDNGITVAIDLTVEDLMQDEFSSKRRNKIRLAQKKGVSVEFDETGETVEEFYRLYQNTIQKNEISPYYQFSLAFLKAHFKALGSHVCIANAKVDGKVISSSFILQCGDHIHYHLSANDYTMMSYQGNSLLLYEVAKRGKAFGCRYLHLGGVGVAEMSLMDFKLSFTRNGSLPFYVGTRVRDEHIFTLLTKKYGTGQGNYFPPYRGAIC